jgi:hypothetical protein
MNICEICEKEPGSHSFTYLCRTTNKNIFEYVFYTCIGDSKKYNDPDGIITHYTNCLNTMNPDKWIWVFNCDGFGLKHYTEVSTISRLAHLIKTYGKVENIYIVNSPGLLDIVLKIVRPILDTETYKKIKVINPENLLNSINLENNDHLRLKNLLVRKYS